MLLVNINSRLLNRSLKLDRHIRKPNYVMMIVPLLLLLLPVTVRCQFYPRPLPIHPGSAENVAANLRKAETGTADLHTLLLLSNIYLYKPRRSVTDLAKCLTFASNAKKVAFLNHDTAAFNMACSLMADALIQNDRIEDAERIVNEVHGKTRVDLLFTLSYCYILRQSGTDSANLLKATTYINKAISLVEKQPDWKPRNTALRIKGAIHTAQGDFLLAEKELTRALNESKRRADPNIQYNYMDLARLYFSKGDYNKSLSAALDAEQQANLRQDSIALGDAHFMLAVVFRNTGHLDKADDNFRQALQIYLRFQGTYSATSAIRGLGHILIGKKKYWDALHFFQTYFKKYPAMTFGDRQFETGSIGDCYLKLKKYEVAEQYFMKEFNTAKNAGALSEFSFHRMAYFYIETKNYQKARPYLLKALNYQEQVSVQSKGHLYYMLFLADSASGNYRSAIGYLKKNKEVDETIYQQTKVKEIQDLTAGYEATQRVQEIKLLKKNDQLKDMDLKNAELVRNVSVAAIFVFILGGIVFYRQNQKKLQISALVTQKNKQLEVLLNEKEWLLKEIHHRVKNNLQTVVGLLQIQSEFLTDDALLAVENSQHRIYAMSLIHQKLYLTDDTQQINLAIYLQELADYLKDSFGGEPEVAYILDVEPLTVDISHAITLGLIVNEAVSNAVKHAFPHRKNGIVKISLVKKEGSIVLAVSDNGIGFSRQKSAPEKRDSMGVQLIEGLCRDIDASVSFENKNGTIITVEFKLLKQDKVPFDI